MIVRALRRRGVVGLNRRNAVYVQPMNPRHLFPRVDDKVLSKRLLVEAGIPVPREIGVIRHHYELAKLREMVEGEEGFVMKPARGSQGNGILVVRERGGQRLLRGRRRSLSLERIRFHASEILSGLFSLGGQPDQALMEEVLSPDESLHALCGDGVPDLRVVVYRGVPAMAMLRLPTSESGGRANLHQGALGVGIDLDRGRASSAIRGRDYLTRHPDTDAELSGFPLPRFDECLLHSARVARTIGLGYVGIDLVVDDAKGPVVLEVNARPGLSIQLANRAGLGLALDAIDRLPESERSETECIEVAREISRQVG